MKPLLSFLVGTVLLLPAAAPAQFIWLDCSFKAVLSPKTGERYYAFTEADIDTTLNRVNQYLAGYMRGYRLRRTGPIYDIGGLNDTTGPSKWYYMDPGALYPPDTNHDYQYNMDLEAKTNALYQWNPAAINYYILGADDVKTNAFGQPIGWPQGAGCPPPSHIVTLRTVHYPLVILHETGHWFNLMHTHGNCDNKEKGICGNTNDCHIVKNGFLLGNEEEKGFEDTLPVQAGDYCFTTQDLVALANFDKPYAACSPKESNLVDDVFFNLMSYGFGRSLDRLTPQQLDRWTDTANMERGFALSGRTLYVSPYGNDWFSGLTNRVAKRTVADAIRAANPNGTDIVLLRPGNYNERFTINQPVTIRAAPTNTFPEYLRSATIGIP